MILERQRFFKLSLLTKFHLLLPTVIFSMGLRSWKSRVDVKRVCFLNVAMGHVKGANVHVDPGA